MLDFSTNTPHKPSSDAMSLCARTQPSGMREWARSRPRGKLPRPHGAIQGSGPAACRGCSQLGRVQAEQKAEGAATRGTLVTRAQRRRWFAHCHAVGQRVDFRGLRETTARRSLPRSVLTRCEIRAAQSSYHARWVSWKASPHQVELWCEICEQSSPPCRQGGS